jgi:hypothetical protein
MANFYNNFLPRIQLVAYNPQTVELRVNILDEKTNTYRHYVYKEVYPPQYEKLKKYLKHNNNRSAFFLLQNLDIEERPVKKEKQTVIPFKNFL